MRTTLTIDDDLAAKISIEMRRSGRSFKETVNHLLRVGINAKRELRSGGRFEVKARDMGVLPGLDYDNISELLEQVEGSNHK